MNRSTVTCRFDHKRQKTSCNRRGGNLQTLQNEGNQVRNCQKPRKASKLNSFFLEFQVPTSTSKENFN